MATLSKSWKVQRQHRGFYTGGKVVLTTAESHLVCQHGDDLVWTHVGTGQVAATLNVGDGDSILAFACAPNDTDVMVACRSGLIKHFTVGLAASAPPVLVRSFKGASPPSLLVCV